MSLNRSFPLAVAALAVAALFALTRYGGAPLPEPANAAGPKTETAIPMEGLELATFGSGCFWCVEKNFDKVPGVVATISGYMGGTTKNPTYQTVSSGTTGHVEVLQVAYDPEKVTYKKLLDYFWRTTDILDGGGQFCDRGNHYRPIVFAHTPEQRRLAEQGKASIDASKRFDKPVAVEIADASTFTPAEDYHQDYYKKNPRRYTTYRYGCGRDQRIKALWGDSDATH